ncbi:MAG: Blue-light-activated protein [Candidatus Heimdallarchaeota archaeon LC_3]|nr:MAG: Blue-light-activated protein [Candidatus Heimdallarchaeota archaeon LC_3]
MTYALFLVRKMKERGYFPRTVFFTGLGALLFGVHHLGEIIFSHIPIGLVFSELAEIVAALVFLLAVWNLEEEIHLKQRINSVGELAGELAHNFNNLLAIIVGNLSLVEIEMDNFTEIQKKLIINTLKASERATKLIKQFQNLSKGTLSEKSCLDLYNITEEVFQFLQNISKDIEKVITFPAGEFFVLGNSTELNQVFINLSTNSLFAIRAKGVDVKDQNGNFIKVSAEKNNFIGKNLLKSKQDDKRTKVNYIKIVFEDSGIGFTKESLRRVFEPLYTTKKEGSVKGSGLGMTYVYNVITADNRGRITVENRPDQGARITLYLPECLPDIKPVSVEKPKKQNGLETILVVDDEAELRDLLIICLQKVGYSVITAENGKEALEIFKQKQSSIDLILLDMVMPIMSGIEVVEEISKLTPEKKIIIMSGHFQDQKMNNIELHEKILAYLIKPFSMPMLLNKIRDGLDSKIKGNL